MIDRSGQQLDNYRLLKLLGRGSFGEVYLAEHIVRKTQAAIKIFNIDSNQVNQPDMLEEISNLVRLNGHPNIIRIAGFSVKPPAPFIVMDYAPNGTLAKKHSRGMPVPLATIMTYVKQIASALQYAHEENLIHRDVKPANILIAQDSTLLLSDFGITIPSQSMLVAHRRLQDFAGTPEYMAPEQIQYLPSRASDQYALAILVYEWLTGYPPFMGNQGDILNKHLSIAPAPLPNIVPPELASVIMKALSKNSKDRYSTIRGFASALEQAGNEVLQLSQTSTVVEPLPLPVVKRKRKTKEQSFAEGNEHYDAERYNEAIAAYSRTLELDPAFADAYHNRGTAYYYLKRYEEAMRDYNKVLELDPNDAGTYTSRGTAYYGIKNYERAIADYDHALALDPNFTAAREYRELALQELQEEQKKSTPFWRRMLGL